MYKLVNFRFNAKDLVHGLLNQTITLNDMNCKHDHHDHEHQFNNRQKDNDLRIGQ
jgi:hypothetical protein